MPAMKLPYLRTRKYKNKAGDTWIGYYYEPPRGSAGAPGVKPKPIALGSQLVKGKAPATPPAEVLQEYGKACGKNVALPAAQGTVQAVYEAWHTWAELEVKAKRLAKRSLTDYERHWAILKPVFGAGHIDALTQPLLLDYFDRRSSKDRGKREVNFLGLLCSWAAARGRRAAPSPVDRGLRKQMKVDKKPKARPVTAEAYWVVWHCGDQLVRDALDLAYQLATRPAEVLSVPMPEPGAIEIEAPMPKTARSGRAAKMVPITPELSALIERRRKLQPHSLYVLFDDRGQQLRAAGVLRARLYKARDLAKQVCEAAEIKWVDFTLQQLRPTAITQVDKSHGREEARKLGGHTTEKQTAHYVRHGAELVTPAALPAPNIELQRKVEEIKLQLARTKP
jgi:hypothetical protein